MMKFLKSVQNKEFLEEVDFYNIEKKYLSNFDELIQTVINNFLILTAVDGKVDEYLKKALKSQNARFEFISEVCLLYPESTQTFIEYIKDIPECAFFCCKEKPSEENMKTITSGYFEEFGNILKKRGILKGLQDEINMLDSFLYVSQGDCNLLIGLKN